MDALTQQIGGGGGRCKKNTEENCCEVIEVEEWMSSCNLVENVFSESHPTNVHGGVLRNSS